jgi:hypothetical protein
MSNALSASIVGMAIRESAGATVILMTKNTNSGAAMYNQFIQSSQGSAKSDAWTGRADPIAISTSGVSSDAARTSAKERCFMMLRASWDSVHEALFVLAFLIWRASCRLAARIRASIAAFHGRLPAPSLVASDAPDRLRVAGATFVRP